MNADKRGNGLVFTQEESEPRNPRALRRALEKIGVGCFAFEGQNQGARSSYSSAAKSGNCVRGSLGGLKRHYEGTEKEVQGVKSR